MRNSEYGNTTAYVSGSVLNRVRGGAVFQGKRLTDYAIETHSLLLLEDLEIEDTLADFMGREVAFWLPDRETQTVVPISYDLYISGRDIIKLDWSHYLLGTCNFLVLQTGYFLRLQSGGRLCLQAKSRS
jgi:hypothetical protein